MGSERLLSATAFQGYMASHRTNLAMRCATSIFLENIFLCIQKNYPTQCVQSWGCSFIYDRTSCFPLTTLARLLHRPDHRRL
jgi:hypothetical protein